MDFTFGDNTFKTGTANTTFYQCDWAEYVAFMAYWRRKLRPATDWHKLSETPWHGFYQLKPNAEQRTKPCLQQCTDGIAFDMDKTGWTVERLDNRLAPFKRLYYTTTKSRYSAQRWRVVLQCDRYKTNEEQEALWRSLNVILDGEIDQQTKDCTRLHYVPAIWTNADNSWEERDGLLVPVDPFVEAAPPPPEPVLRVRQDDGTMLDVGEISVIQGDQPPYGDPIITDAMIARQATGKPRGGRMWKLLTGAACRYKLRGWALTDQQLLTAAERVHNLISPRQYRHDLLRECSKALAYAEAYAQEKENHSQTPLSAMKPLDRYRAKLTYHLSRSS